MHSKGQGEKMEFSLASTMRGGGGGEHTTCASTASFLNIYWANARCPLIHPANRSGIRAFGQGGLVKLTALGLRHTGNCKFFPQTCHYCFDNGRVANPLLSSETRKRPWMCLLCMLGLVFWEEMTECTQAMVPPCYSCSTSLFLGPV